MSTKEFRKLNKAELLEVIYRMQLNEQTLQEELERWKEKAQRRYEQLEHAGNLAEAALSIHEVFSAAQSAADDYVLTVSARADRLERSAQEFMLQAYTYASAVQSFVLSLKGEEPVMDSFRLEIEGLLDKIASCLPQEQDGNDPVGEEL